ncbi:hypothetical protein Ahy_B07g088491 isoform C [Arachis hypogaea]|uniref:Probable magnesium transporter n=1 Tax=Arachis hypogaea TaxID=3818 RepID=A0A444YEN5_ARAHY|nr:hypothetical protein Ahy_B07g088491 isoform C [Arachis hypogaea]
MALSKQNFTGLVLALVSSAFIGASFIIKKQGLRRAAAISGVRAGVGGYSYLLEPLWWVGMITKSISLWFFFSDCWRDCKFCCLCICPSSSSYPSWRIEHYREVFGFTFSSLVGVKTILTSNFGFTFCMAMASVSAVLAQIILKEKLHPIGVLGCIMCIAGSIIIVIHAPREQPIKSVLEIWSMATQPAFLVYVGSVVVLVFILVFHFAPRCGHTNVLVYTGICSLMGSLSVMSVKALGTSLKLTFEGKNQLIYPETWFFMLVVAFCVIMQMNYLNKDWDGQGGGTIVSEICGFIVVISGTILLHATKDFDRNSSFRGSQPSSPTLSVRLFNGNGELLLKEDEENISPGSMCARRQELY